MANFYESKPMQWVKKAGEKVVGNKGIQAISSGMMMVMGVILLGAVFQLLAVILQTIGIIEAMKLMNEIPATCDGVVESILVKNEQTVEYGQPLVQIRP